MWWGLGPLGQGVATGSRHIKAVLLRAAAAVWQPPLWGGGGGFNLLREKNSRKLLMHSCVEFITLRCRILTRCQPIIFCLICFFAMNFSIQRRLCNLVFGMWQAEVTGGADFAATKYVQQVALAVAVELSHRSAHTSVLQGSAFLKVMGLRVLFLLFKIPLFMYCHFYFIWYCCCHVKSTSLCLIANPSSELRLGTHLTSQGGMCIVAVTFPLIAFDA